MNFVDTSKHILPNMCARLSSPKRYFLRTENTTWTQLYSDLALPARKGIVRLLMQKYCGIFIRPFRKPYLLMCWSRLSRAHPKNLLYLSQFPKQLLTPFRKNQAYIFSMVIQKHLYILARVSI